nr:uncharacterized protein LOC124814172 [Hydra vulgaris]
MGKKNDISPKKYSAVKTLLGEKVYTQTQIALKVGVSQKTVSRIKKCVDNQEPYEHHRIGNCGRKRKITPRTQRNLVKMALNNRRATSKVLCQQLNEAGVDVSPVTVQRRLFESGLKSRRPRKKQKVTPAMAKKRLEWAKIHENMSIYDWSKVKCMQKLYSKSF